jgi:shikimate kinase
MNNVVLIGFMGTGKTSSGKLLASRLGYRFVDLDQAIEAAAGKSIPQIFADEGEAVFRQQEKAMTQKIAAGQHTVISTGGGTVKDPENMMALRRNGAIVCLTADVDAVLERTGHHGSRPVLDKEDHGDRREAVRKLMLERQHLYAQADHTVDTTELSPLQVVEDIVHYLQKEGMAHA